MRAWLTTPLGLENGICTADIGAANNGQKTLSFHDLNG
jgi:hypothetical protein